MVQRTNISNKRMHINLSFFRKRRRVLVVLLVVTAIATIVGVVKYNAYTSRFSDKDYAAIAAAAERVFKNVGAKDIARDESCRYRARAEYEENRLYCRVGMVAYIVYENDAQALRVANALDKEILAQMGQHSYGFSNFYEQPHDGHDVTTVTISRPGLPRGHQCNFFIDSNDQAKDAVDFLPERAEDNLIAISFACSGESREEYFPVTYRQGV